LVRVDAVGLEFLGAGAIDDAEGGRVAAGEPGTGDLDATVGADQVDAAAAGRLEAAVEEGGVVAVFEQAGGGHVAAARLVAGGPGGDGAGGAAAEVARGVDAVATDVQEGAGALLGLEA